MRLKEPYFWQHKTVVSLLLWPISALFCLLAHLQRKMTRPIRVSVPVICVGNVRIGGTGKTPTVLALCEILKEMGLHPHVISRGYKGSIKQTTRVDLAVHTFHDVGDEPLLIAAETPCWVGADRVSSANSAIEAGATVIVMDDGFQNPSLYKDIGVLVLDPHQGLGNGFQLPAGPLRESLSSALKRTDIIVKVGEGKVPALHKPIFEAHINPADELTPKRVAAFAGLGNPAKFMRTLTSAGFDVVKAFPYPDHHAYTEKDMTFLSQEAKADNLTLITTAKDAVRIPPAWRDRVDVLKIKLVLKDPKAMQQLLKSQLST